MKKYFVLIALLTVLSLAACSNTADSVSLDGKWQLVSLNGASIATGVPITLNVEGDQVSGHGGCNTFGGEISLDAETLTFGPITRTEMACEEQAAMTQENAFFAKLIDVRGYRIGESGVLQMTDTAGVVVLAFEPADGTSNQSRGESDSTAVSIDNSEPTPVAVVEPPAGVEVYIPENWSVTGVIEGEFATLQSYPEDKYIGGEAREPGDTKCDLTIRPAGIDVASQIEEITAATMVTVLSEETITLPSGTMATRFEIDSLGLCHSVVTEINGRTVVLTCFGDLTIFDQIAATLAVAI